MHSFAAGKREPKKVFQNLRVGPKKYDVRFVPTKFRKPIAPFGLTVYKGLKNVMITRRFSEFLLNHPVAVEFYKWLEDVRVPDELFYQTLARIVKIDPSSSSSSAEKPETARKVVQQDHEMNTDEAGMVRYTVWAFEKK